MNGQVPLGKATLVPVWYVQEASDTGFHKSVPSARTTDPIRAGKESFDSVQWREDIKVDSSTLGVI